MSQSELKDIVREKMKQTAWDNFESETEESVLPRKLLS